MWGVAWTGMAEQVEIMPKAEANSIDIVFMREEIG
jgi:hypothetical protein